MISILLAFAAAAGLLLWILIRRAAKRSAAHAPPRENFHCVSISFPESACDAVKRIQAHRFLSDEAPLLPLTKCNVGNCTCRYAHFPDRREDLRRNPYGLRRSVPPPTIGGDRRGFPDRRKRVDPH